MTTLRLPAPIANSYGSPSSDSIAEEDRVFLLEFPEDYRAFLDLHNGGTVEKASWSFDTGVPFKTDTVDNPSRTDFITAFFGVTTETSLESPPEDLQCLAADHVDEGFLPAGVVAVARCIQNGLVCISTRPEDFGRVYYWDWYWRYPWCKAFFEARIADARKSFPEYDVVAKDQNHPRFQELADHLNYATLVPLAPTWTAFVSSCRDEREQK